MALNFRGASARKEPPGRSPEREALAALIAQRDGLERQVDATKRALAELRRVDDDIRAAVNAAKEAVEKAKVNGAAYLVAVAGGTAGDAPQSIKDARAVLQAATDDLETHEMAESSLEAKLEAEENSLSFLPGRIDNQIQKVMAAEPAFRKLFDDYEELRALTLKRAKVLSFLFHWTPRELQFWQATKRYDDSTVPDETGPWREALAALEKNADAPLPVT